MWLQLQWKNSFGSLCLVVELSHEMQHARPQHKHETKCDPRGAVRFSRKGQRIVLC